MNKLLSCRYNMDTNRVEARFEDGTTLAIDCIAVEDEYGSTPAPVSYTHLDVYKRQINIHTIKPLDEEIVLKAAKECGKVITAEEHNVIGGLGEAVCAVLSEKLPTPVRRVGVQDVFGCSGPAWDLLKKFGLDAATICKTAHEMLGK